MKYCGIDLHSNNCVVVVSDEDDRCLLQQRFPNNLTHILAALGRWRDEINGVVVESTYNWYWLVDGLIDAGYKVHLANTVAIKKYEGLKYSGDAADAAYLAQLLRLNLLPEGYIYPPAERSAWDLGRKRMQLVQCRVAQILAIENIVARHTGGRISIREIDKLTDEKISVFGFASDVALALKANLAVSHALIEQIKGLEKRLKEIVQLRSDFRLLKTMPGIGDILATTIMLETGTIARFPNFGNFSSYCRCVGSPHESNGKKKGEGNTKNGNKYLAWAFVEAANLHYDFVQRQRVFTNARSVRLTSLLHARRWRINWRVPATMFYASKNRSM